MKKSTLLMSFVMGFLLVGSAWAASSKSSATSSSMKMSGTIVSSNSSQLVLSSKSNGKSEQETFVLNPQTKTKGTLAAGDWAIVHYKNENGQKVVTTVTAHPEKTAKTASKTK
jgi:hypothetical protein